jgi:hypothetical protein
VTPTAAFANAFLCGFLVDCGLTVLDGAARSFDPGAMALLGLRNVLAWVVFWSAPPLALLALLSSRLPRAPLLGLALGTWWVNLGAPPLGPLLDGVPLRDVVLGLVQAALALPALRWIRRRSGGTAWLFRERFLPPARPRRRWAVALVVVAVPLALVLGLAGCAVLVAERATGGFVGFGTGGVSFDERRYRRGDREVVLVGMSHVGRKGVYEALLRQDDRTPTVVLAEGVTDANGLLPGTRHLEPLAADLGLDLQPNVEEMMGAAPDTPAGAGDAIEIEHADVDVSAFRPSTLELLRLAFRLAAEPADAEARAELEALLGRPDAAEAYRGFLDDVLEKRNAHVLERIDAALERRPRAVVPWGALHLAGIEAGLFERGFVLASSEPRSFLPYRALAEALLRMGAP